MICLRERSSSIFFWPNMQKILLPSIFLGTLLISRFQTFATCSKDGFTFNGFTGANLSLDGVVSITSDGLLELTNSSIAMKGHGHAFYPTPLSFKSRAGKPLSFSTTFVFAIITGYPGFSGHGFALVVSPTTNFSTAAAGNYLGLFNSINNGNSSNHVFAVELDTFQSSEFQDIDDNHVGVDVNSLRSVYSHTAGYYDADSNGLFKNLTLNSGEPMQVWIDFNGEDMQLNVTMSPLQTPKPNRPLLSSTVDLSSVLLDSMYVGFSASSISGLIRISYYILGWSFKMNAEAEPLDYSKLPPLPHSKAKSKWKELVISPLASFCFVLMVIGGVLFLLRRNRYAEQVEEWELEYGPHHFSYRDLYRATKGFKDEELVGLGGFGRVYRGVLPTSNMEVAVKRVSHESRQGMKEFVAEIASIGQLRHRNIVQLFGYCRRKGELLLVYDYMPNGSLDKFLHDRLTQPALDWARRFQIIKGVASGLLYLHEDWERVVVHRDVKASNVLLDGEMNGKLGDFGLARLYDHGTDPHTTHVVGTMGYVAPEAARTGKATTKTDVFAFGAFLLEVACGRRPVEPVAEGEQLVLVDWVLEHWKRGSVLVTSDPRLGEEYSVEEIELVLTLGLLCSHPMPAARPSMRQVMQYLDGSTALPELSPTYMSYSIPSLKRTEWLDDYILSFPSSVATVSTSSVSEGQ